MRLWCLVLSHRQHQERVVGGERDGEDGAVVSVLDEAEDTTPEAWAVGVSGEKTVATPKVLVVVMWERPVVIVSDSKLSRESANSIIGEEVERAGGICRNVSYIQVYVAGPERTQLSYCCFCC